MYAVVIPVYNGQNFIVETLDSIVRQTVQPSRIIVINDCSSDDTLSLLEEYKKNLRSGVEFEILSTDEASGSAAKPRNIGLSRLNGMEYVAFCDADDLWYQDKARIQLEAFSKYQCDAVYTAVKKFSGDFEYPKAIKADSENRVVSVCDFKYDNPVKSCSSMFVSAKCFEFLRFPIGVEFRGVEDYYCWLELYLGMSNLKIMKIELPLVGYRQHNESISNSKLSMSLLRMRTYYYKRGLLEKIGVSMPNGYFAEMRYIIRQLFV